MYKAFFNIRQDSDAHTEYIKPINDFIVDFYQNIGADFDYQTRLIQKTNLPTPRFCSTIDNPQNQQDLILLSIDNCSYWCKVIYQLSHELTHCYIFCHNKNKSQEINWIEETICEALSLFFLKYFFINWKSMELSKINSGFSKHIATYLDDILKEPWRKAIVKTKFFHFLLGLKKITQDATQKVYQFVPMQDFSKPWTDAELYAKYKLSQNEIDFIESMIRPME